ncbi:MAG: hypothetical protein NWE88_11975 [Candidatus Bathyarchaeota archaeon]|nr:hypothetical protein [Candidatus Bathyarchaeota archaeon]
MSLSTVEKKNKDNPGTLPDKTIVYSYEEANKRLKNIIKKKISVSDVILVLLYSHSSKPIFGRISLMKQVFLLIEEVLNKGEVQDAKFVPYHFGMYSFTVGASLTNLEYSGFIEQRGKKNTKLERFFITTKGERHISSIFNEFSYELQNTIREKRQGWDQLGYDGILRLVYQNYPEYIDKSQIKERYKAIKWGRGRG